jgi:hypothetical protein
MQIKTSELTGAAFNWAVAKCEGVPNIHIVKKPGKVCIYGEIAGVDFPYQPSTDWSQGGPIIEREKFTVMYDDDWKYDPTDPEDNGERWMADNGDSYYNPTQYGATPLIAAMRCYVASKLGDDINIPEELL